MPITNPIRIGEKNFGYVCRKWNVGLHCPGAPGQPGNCGKMHRCVYCNGDHPVKDCQERDIDYRKTYGATSRRVPG